MGSIRWTIAVAVIAGSTARWIAAEPVPPKSHPDTRGWKNLFAEDLSDASFPAGVWRFDGGVLTATADECIWTREMLERFVLDLEFKNDTGTNSGVIVYCSDLANWIPHSVEIQIADDYATQWERMPASWHCGAVFGRLGPRKRTVKQAGQWNRCTLTCDGKMIYVVLNGELITELDMSRWTDPRKNPDGSEIPPWLSKPLASLPTRGYVGLQGRHAGVPVYFRNLKIRSLDPR